MTDDFTAWSWGVLVVGAVGGAAGMAVILHRKGAGTLRVAQESMQTMRVEMHGMRGDVARLEQQLRERESTHTAALDSKLTHLHTQLGALSSMSGLVSDLSSVLQRPQARGAFGERQLQDLVQDVMPPNAFTVQAPLKGGAVRVDMLIAAPSPALPLAVDSKFPLEAFRDLLAAGEGNTASEAERGAQVTAARTRLGKAFKLHVRAVADKYIVPGETADSALLFLPSEAIFAELHANHPSIVEEAERARVWFTSPTTMMATLNMMKGAMRDAQFHEQSKAVLNEVRLLIDNVERMNARSEAAEKHLEKATESLRQLRVSTNKIARQGSTLLAE